ncbi:hypothetical protein IVB45_13995 [Bradyrhizobium sp. 4]|uniref:hypothetical protein n=1 Tax=unclassified Bradyrhizobium TaxID=2631580 RepID=UPI001FF80C3A|nr:MULTISPECIES: hypothetical protein [unclassified Bradyrhizobium]MCK1403776.1 hypothetical protein [Bradyrhizobium sp. 39]MCK1751406.1 hypothetical protein [Bradyrhizobium sp. 135]UPJ37864.1 hypothetical protein IVB45_13995 [Bradyrhizobium sp. 4]
MDIDVREADPDAANGGFSKLNCELCDFLSNSSWRNAAEDRGRLGGLMRVAEILTSIASISLSLGIGAMSPTAAAQEQKSFRFSTSSIPPRFNLGDRVEASRQVRVRASGSLGGPLLGTQPAGVYDKLVAGRASANGYIPWRIAHDNGVDGPRGNDNSNPPPASSSPAPAAAPAPTPAPAPSSMPSSGPPLSFNDPRFTSAISHSRLDDGVPDGGSLTDRSYIYYEVGDNTVGCWGSCTLTRLRIQSRECIRAIKGNIVIADSYLEATGQGDDHADVIQAYGPGNHGTITLRNTSIVAHNTSATAGIFVADNWKPDLIDLENVMFQGGPFGLRLHADGYMNAHLRMKNVCFVGPFPLRKFFITDFIIDEWTNVNDCVIQNGQLVIVKSIRRP